MKKLTEIRQERPYYFVSIGGNILFEDDSFTNCKNYLINYIKEHKEEMLEKDELYNYYIGMYSISID